MPADDISGRYVADQRLGVSYPDRAVIWVDGIYCFEASDPADWRAVLARAGTTDGIIAIPDNGTPGDAWCEADLRLARLVRCACGQHLDPDSEAFTVLSCDACNQRAGWENTHNDRGHHDRPDPDRPVCTDTHAATPAGEHVDAQ